ncbi:ATP-dependent DNA helicase PIF1 [Yarrowia sp. E02]|nr:ATP-dependent DNA helicase PIF1 [Yarrowia sp. E02]
MDNDDLKNKGETNTHEHSVTLTDEQQAIFKKVKDRQSLIFTGQAGTGKSVLIQEIARWCNKEGIKCAVTAPTGLASVNIKGQTLYKWAGLGLMKATASECISRLKKKKASYNWYATDLLIIDEASQVPGSMFDKMDTIARHVRAERSKFAEGGSWAHDYSPQGHEEDNYPPGKDLKEVPFGGMQVVCVGDFFQIAPIEDAPMKPKVNPPSKKGKKWGAVTTDQDDGKGKNQAHEPDYLFKSKVFQELYEYNKFRLTIAQRQERGSEFSNMLDSLRRYNGAPNDSVTLKEYFSQYKYWKSQNAEHPSRPSS